MSTRKGAVTRRVVARAKPRKVVGYGAYKSKKAGGGGKHYYAKYKAAKAASAAASSDSGGWLSSGLGILGDALPIPMGGAIGRGIGSLIKSITGFGDYQIQENSLIPEAGTPPAISNTAAGKVAVIQHREYISDVISSATPGAFKVDSYFINPGQNATMPWLAGIAANYEHYQIRGMIFEFKTMSADALNSTNTALGQVIMATNYNSALANFGSKYEMENYQFGQSCKPSHDAVHPIECKRTESVLGDLYVRPAGVPSGQDQRLYDFGNFQIATNGLQAASVNVGELWVTYEIALYKPKLWTALGNAVQIYQATGTGANASNPFNAAVADTTNTIALTLTSAATSLVTFPASVKYGQYYMIYSYSGTVAAVQSVTGFGVNAGCTFSATGNTPTNGDTAKGFSCFGLMKVTAPGPVAQMVLTTIPSGTTSWTLTVFQVPQLFT